MQLEIGETYLIKAQRKGTFMMRVENVCDVWTRGVIVGGKADAILEYNERTVGDEVTCRTSFIMSAIKQPQ